MYIREELLEGVPDSGIMSVSWGIRSGGPVTLPGPTHEVSISESSGLTVQLGDPSSIVGPPSVRLRRSGTVDMLTTGVGVVSGSSSLLTNQCDGTLLLQNQS